MNRLRVLVVDDEPLALEMIQSMVARDSELEVVGGAADGRQAAAEIERLEPDIVLLDIEMPEANGLEAVGLVEGAHEPVFIFVTAYDQYAAEAFEVEALDYVLKPVSDHRLTEALTRAKQRVRERRLSEVGEKVLNLTSDLAEAASEEQNGATDPSYMSRLPISADGRTRFIKTEDIFWIESQDYYVKVHARHGSPLVRVTLKSLAERLDPRRFCQVRRGALVNVAEVAEIQRLFKGAYALVLSDGTELRISRSRWQEVREQLAPRLRSS